MSRTAARIAALALLWIMLARMLDTSARLSPVVDEQSHISRGVSVWRTGDLRLQIGHPIGLNLWQTLPLALDPNVRLPLDHEAWANAAWDRFGDQFLWRINDHPDGLVFRPRLMVMLLALVLGALVFRWADDWHGPNAAVLSVALYTLDPNILAHGSLATTDLGVTLFMFASVYALWRAMRAPSRRAFFGVGALAGLAFVSKYSALALIPIVAVLLALKALRERQVRSIFQPSSLILLSSALVLLVVYAFRIDLYIRELGFLVANTQTHPSFLLGQRSLEGWWYYFVVTFLFKTPLPTLLTIGVAVAAVLRRRAAGDAYLVIPALIYFAFSLVSGFNVGYRHLLPALPFLLVLASRALRPRPSSGLGPRASRFAFYASRILTGLLVVWLAASSFATHPDYIAYFNEAAPSPRYNVLIDSNLDWGQSLKELRVYLGANGIRRVKLSYFGTADPAAYGIEYDRLPRWPPPKQTDFIPANPAPGVYAISASNLQGILLDDPSAFDWFRHRNPDAIVGHSILIYHVAADPNPPQAVGVCREPWTPIDDENVDALFGREGLRVVRFDCASAWWRPNVPVWYVVPAEKYGSMGVVEYAKRRGDDSLVYAVLRGSGVDAPAQPLNTPAQFEGGLSLLGFNGLGAQAAGSFVVESVWRVDAPPSPPVSIFAHLLDASGPFVASADGLGVPAELLRAGDIIIQRHHFDAPPDGQYTIEFGFYRLDTLERYFVVANGQRVDQRVVTEPFGITR